VVDEFDNTPLKLCAAEGHSELLKVGAALSWKGYHFEIYETRFARTS
jgi:hypothetical protein